MMITQTPNLSPERKAFQEHVDKCKICIDCWKEGKKCPDGQVLADAFKAASWANLPKPWWNTVEHYNRYMAKIQEWIDVADNIEDSSYRKRLFLGLEYFPENIPKLDRLRALKLKMIAIVNENNTEWWCPECGGSNRALCEKKVLPS